MKKLKFLLVALTALCSVGTARAQATVASGYDVLGTWCYISVDFQNDPVTSDGYFKYTIPFPNARYEYCSVQGPGSPYLFNHLGSTVDIYIKKIKLELDAEGYDSVPIEFFVDKWWTLQGGYRSSPVDSSNILSHQCYYQIILNITW